MAKAPHGRPSSARPSAVTGRDRGGSRSQRPHSARAGLFLPHPPAQQPPDVAGGSGVRPTSAYRARLDYQKKLDQKREVTRQARAEEEREEREKKMNAARQRGRNSTLQWNGFEAPAAQAVQETSEPEDRVDEPTGSVDEPTGSFRRRRVAHDAVMQSLKQENPRADRRAAPPLGHEWRDLNRGLSNLFRTRPAPSSAKKKRNSVLTGFRASESAPIPLLRQKALSRQMGTLKEFYANGQAGRVLGEVDKSFAKRRANPDGVTKTWAMEVDKKREQLAPWAASNPEAVLGRKTETIAQRRERLRAEMAEKRRVRESMMTGGEDDVDSAFTLRTNEHASLGLQLALHREARDAKRQAKRKDVIRPIGPRAVTEVENRVAACIVPLCEQAESKSVEVQRDVAAALYSLSIAEENKPAFVEAQALETLIAMAQSKDPDIRRNIAGAIYRLSMCTSIKRQFVELGVLRPLLLLAQGSKDREVQRYSILAIKELSEKRANHSDILDAHALPILYTNLESTDPRIRKEAIWTLDHLADEDTNRLRLLRSGALSVVLEHLQVQDVNVRRGSASTMLKFAKLLEVAPADIVKELNSKKTLSALIDALKDRDLDVSTDLCKSLVIMKSATLIKLMLSNKGLAHVLSHANRLVSLDGTGAIHTNLAQVMTVLLTFMPAKVPQNVMVVMDEGYMSTLLHLCKYNSGKVRRSAGKLLARLSTIEASKAKMMADPEIVPLLNSLCKQSDYSSRMTAVKVIAELAEEPKNRLPLYLAAVLPTLFEQIRKGDDEMRFQCARAIADMAEAVELRVAIVYAGLELILECMLSEDDQVQEQGMRILVNLAAPAGFACGAEAGEVGRYGALEALQVDDDLDETSSSDESCDSDDSADSSDEDSDEVGEDDAMDKIANMIDAQGLHDSGPRLSATPLPGGLAGLAAEAALIPKLDASSSSEEDDFDDVEDGDDHGDSGGDEEAKRSVVLARARLLVRKAAILEKERDRSKRNAEEEDDTKPVIPLAQLVGPAAAIRSGTKKPKGAKSRPATAGGYGKTESNFSRYRRQSAYSIADEKKGEKANEPMGTEKKKPKAQPRKLSVGWGDMASLLGNTTDGQVDEQSDEWWSTPEGERVKLKHNTINVDRIHLKIAETNVVKRLLELVFDDTPHVSEYAVAVINFMVGKGEGAQQNA